MPGVPPSAGCAMTPAAAQFEAWWELRQPPKGRYLEAVRRIAHDAFLAAWDAARAEERQRCLDIVMDEKISTGEAFAVCMMLYEKISGRKWKVRPDA